MRKIRIVGFGLFAVLALCAYAAVPAFAADEWLVGGAAFEGALSAETAGTLTLRKFAGASSAEVLTELTCTGILDGTITGLEGGLSTLTDVLTEDSLTTIGTLVDTNKTALNCTVKFDAGALTDCENGSLASVWLIGLNLELEETAAGEILLNGTVTTGMGGPLNNLGGAAGYDVECKSLIGVNGSEECTGSTQEATLSNEATVPPSIDGLLAASPVAMRSNCTMTGEHSADVVGLGNTWAIGAELEHLETSIN